jgi:CRP/FNR family cyclic AMP-dependent transcriptional regulator
MAESRRAPMAERTNRAAKAAAKKLRPPALATDARGIDRSARAHVFAERILCSTFPNDEPRMSDLTHGLASVRIFQHLGPDDLQKVAKISKPKRLAANTVVFFEGNRADAFFIVISGSLKVYQAAHDGRVKMLSTMGPGETFGELAMLDGQGRSATVETTSPTELLVIARKDFRDLAMATPGILWGVLENVCARLRAQNDSELEAAFHGTHYRIAKAVIRLAEKHGRKTDAGVRIAETFGVKDIAEMAATTVERVQRALEKLEDDGLVLVAEGLVVPDVSSLRRALDYMGSS